LFSFANFPGNLVFIASRLAKAARTRLKGR